MTDQDVRSGTSGTLMIKSMGKLWIRKVAGIENWKGSGIGTSTILEVTQLVNTFNIGLRQARFRKYRL